MCVSTYRVCHFSLVEWKLGIRLQCYPSPLPPVGVSGEEPNDHVTSPESVIDSTPPAQEQCSSSSDGEVGVSVGVAVGLLLNCLNKDRTMHILPVMWLLSIAGVQCWKQRQGP